ncbi:hypothetical protein SAMN04489707_1005121 [Paenacidovorax caeni]|uniref:Uncharacterized protein n=1 Tax=Paenacidovorax caeni TaxID=343013 RepID=A0A1I7GHR0_9BURK|nr:hypothetical protein [Paenacidovorax caeni]SFU47955.1 hypothetical protein SAMN04489707_1005121 [Paenacidovorax caeni]
MASPSINPHPIEEDSALQSSMRVFIDAVEMLAMPAAEQCQAMGDYNVAWELKDDVVAGRYLLGRGCFTAEQEAWIRALIAALAAVDVQSLPAGPGRAANLAALDQACWEPMRFLAREVVRRIATP